MPSRLKRGLALVALMSVVVEATSHIGLWVLKKARGTVYESIDPSSIPNRHRSIISGLLEGKGQYVTHSSLLGWTNKPNGSVDFASTNGQGIRANREYAAAPPADIVRVSTFGDSFTHGDDVGNDDTWQARMEAAATHLQVLNYGVGGYGLDQALLRYENEGLALAPDIVLIGYQPENIRRHVNVYRPFYFAGTTLPLAKPRFLVRDTTLVLLPNPLETLADYRDLLQNPRRVLSRLGRFDYYFQNKNKSSRLDMLRTVRLLKILYRVISEGPRRGDDGLGGFYAPGSEPLKVTVAIFDRFVRGVRRNGSIPIILILPRREHVNERRRSGTMVYHPLLAHFDMQGYRYVDLVEAFAGIEDSALRDVIPDHYSPTGNQLVATHVLDALQEETDEILEAKLASGR